MATPMAGDPQRFPRREEAPPKIPGYEVLGFIGRGSSGVVYRARQLAVDREVAIKILHPHLARESRIVRRLQREARTTARLAHPHIVSAVDMGETDGRWWYAMEYVDGPSLAQRLRLEGRIREREALRLFIPLCEALEHLAEHGVVHRDIKPANIMIDKAGGARLADLGLAVTEEDPSITGTGGTLGTPHYISPEQAVDPRKADVRSDIWSFGATLFHAVCGRPPFHGESAAEVLSGVLYWPIPDPEELEPALSSRLALVLRKCLTRDPTRRYQDPHELLLDLERVRERRAPKIQRRSLDPVQRRADQARRVAILATGGLVALLGTLFFLVPRFLGRGDASKSLAAPEAGPFEPLEELLERRASGRGKPAELLGELQGLEARVPLRENVRYQELLRAVDADLRKRVREVRTALEEGLEAHIRDGDLEAGWRLFGELEPRFVEAVGYGLSGLASVGMSLEAWRERLVLNLQTATEFAVDELEELLLEWRNQRLASVENALAQQDWERAQDMLTLPGAPELFSQAGFKRKLPSDSQAGLLDDLAGDFRQRSFRLHDDWQEVDRELRNFVLTRCATLERQLKEGRPRIAAEALLRNDFERELFDRRLSRERMPHGLSRAGLEELESSARSLAALEESLREADARADFSETEELAAEALRRRDYGRAVALWEELRYPAGAASLDTPASAELARRVELRLAEARLLDELLERVSARLKALDGQSIALRWGSIVYPHVRIEAGEDPRRDGFHTDTIAGTLRLSDLPSQEVETLAGFGPEAELGAEERLTLAAFRLREGHAAEAQRALYAGPQPTDGPARSLGEELHAGIAAALEKREQRAEEREAEAKRLLADVLDDGFRRHSPRVAQARLRRLLEDFSDVPAVKQQRLELVRVKQRLEESAPADVERELQRAYLPTVLTPIAPGRVRLDYDFGEGHVGAFEGGDWVYDGLGLVLGPRAPVLGWDQLAAQHGLRLILKTPLVVDTFELVLRFETLQGENPGRLLWVTVAGFQVALAAREVPALGADARFLVGTDAANAFLQRLLDGEGRRPDAAIVPGMPVRELRLKALRRSGRCEVFLDGVSLADATGLRAPPSDALTLLVRSWGAVRVLSVRLEGGR